MKTILKTNDGFVIADVGEVYTLAQYVMEVHGDVSLHDLHAHFAALDGPRKKAYEAFRRASKRKYAGVSRYWLTASFKEEQKANIATRPAGSPVPVGTLSDVKRHGNIRAYWTHSSYQPFGAKGIEQVLEALIIFTGDPLLKEAREKSVM